jgi:hypothetical protein
MSEHTKRPPKVKVAFTAPEDYALSFRARGREKAVLFGPTVTALNRLVSRRRNRSTGKRAYTMQGARGVYRAGSDTRQRVLVKTYYSRIKSPAAGLKSLRKYLRYLQLEGKGIDGLEPKLLGTEEGRTPSGIYQNEQHYFRVILSPERGAELDMERFVEEYVKGLERDLKTKLIWTGAIHYNTDSPHAHLLIRGVTDKGETLVIDKGYVKHGMRELGRDIATRFLGLRSELDVEHDRLQELRAPRLTNLDRHLFLAASKAPSHMLRIEPVTALQRDFEKRARIAKLSRLQYLAEPHEFSWWYLPHQELKDQSFIAILPNLSGCTCCQLRC